MAAPLGDFKCSKCNRKFIMAAHLARHMTMTHGVKSKSKAAKGGGRGRRGKGRRGPGRPPGRPAGRKMGRPAGVSGAASRLGLRSMSLEQIAAVIEAAREEARRRIDEYRQAID